MKKTLYSIGISLIAIGISSLSINENKEKVLTPSYRLTDETAADAAGITSCEGCHSGAATNGPIIIVYTDQKKENFELPIMEGTHDIIVYNPSQNDSLIRQLTAYLSQIKINTTVSKPGWSANPNFYALHGGMRADILKNCETIRVESATSTIVTMNTNDILRCNIKQASRNEITVTIDMRDEKLTTLKVVDINGNLMGEQTNLLAKGMNEISMMATQQLAAGLYFMQVKGDHQLITNKFLIP